MKNVLIAVLLGMGLTLAFAPYCFYPLAVLCPAGYLALLLYRSAKQAFWLGFAFGLGFFGSGVSWVIISIHQFGGVGTPVALFITALMVMWLALFPAFAGYLTNRYFKNNIPAKAIYAFPAIWVITEWMRSWLITGFPWLLIGYSQTNSPLRGYAAILGVYGVSFAAILTSGLLIAICWQLKHKAYRAASLQMSCIALIWIAGSLFSLIPWTKATGTPLPVALVQGDIPQSLKWSPEHVDLSLERYATLTTPLWNQAQLIIWPEAAVPLSLTAAENFIEVMDQKAQEHHVTLILGIPIKAEPHGYFNGVVTLGEDKQVYLKRHLVPFGEYTPLEATFSKALRFMNIPMSEMVAGNPYQRPMVLHTKSGPLTIATSICYEIAFPELIRERDPGLNLLLTVTNDAWFGESNARAQHLQMAQMRALELNRAVLFASNNGITAVIDAHGQIAKAAPMNQAVVLTTFVQPTQGLTPWMKNGMDPILLILIFALVLAIRRERLPQPAWHPQNGTAI